RPDQRADEARPAADRLHGHASGEWSGWSRALERGFTRRNSARSDDAGDGRVRVHRAGARRTPLAAHPGHRRHRKDAGRRGFRATQRPGTAFGAQGRAQRQDRVGGPRRAGAAARPARGSGSAMSIIDTDSARAWRIQLAHLRQELLSPVNALLGYAEILHEEASRKGHPDILPDMNRILGAARDLAGKVDRLVDGDRAKSTPGSASATQEQELRHELRTPLNAIRGYGEMLREDVANCSSDSLRADLDRLLVAATDLLLRLDRIVRFSVEVEEMSLASDQTGAVIVSGLMR